MKATPEQEAALALVRDTLAELTGDPPPGYALKRARFLRSVLQLVADAFPEGDGDDTT